MMFGVGTPVAEHVRRTVSLACMVMLEGGRRMIVGATAKQNSEIQIHDEWIAYPVLSQSL